MKEKKLFDAITGVEDGLIEEAKDARAKRGAQPWRKWVAAAACVALVLGVASFIPRGGNPGADALLDVVFPKAYAFDDGDTMRKVVEENPVEDSFVNAINDFSYETASEILKESAENANYSPLSLYYALAMATSGAGGETEQELLALLNMPDAETLSTQCGNLYRRLYVDNKLGKLKIANSLWMDDGVQWKEAFIKQAAENLYASSHSVDFADKTAGEAMAKWVSEQTNGTLEPTFPVNPQQILSIINTVYYKDEWTNKFNKEMTEEGSFYLADGTNVSCDFMNSQYGSAAFATGEGFTRAALGLKNAGGMFFVLPDEGVTPQELLSSPERMKEALQGGTWGSGEVVWQIPKFSFHSAFDLGDTLNTLGLESAFKETADFSKITDQMAFISAVRQETHIAIDENGVEASAFTQIDYTGAAKPEGRADMILNRPFLYGITASNGALLFVGICENPIAG